MATMKRTPIQPVRVEPICGNCGKPLVRANGVVYTTYPAMADFVCENEHTERLSEHEWPRVEYEPINPADAGESSP